MDGLTWNSNVKQILDHDEKIFLSEAKRKSLVPAKDIDAKDNLLNISTASWGQYFASRSPAVSEIFESDDENKQQNIISNIDKNTFHGHKPNNIIDDDSFLSFPSRNSNDSIYSDRHSLTNIHISSLKHIQRFYQFTIKALYKNKIESIISQYINDSFVKRGEVNTQLSAITVNQKTKHCTVLILFQQSNRSQEKEDMYWINSFLSYQPIINALDQSIKPAFTQISD